MKLKLVILGLWVFTNWSPSSAQNARLIIDPQAHAGIVNDLAFTSNGKFLISVSDDKTIRIWDVKNGVLDRTLRTFSGDGTEGAIYALALSPDSKFLAIGGYFETNEIRIIDLERDRDVVLLKGHSNVVTSLDFSNDGLQLASSDVTGVVRLWNINFSDGNILGTPGKVLEGHAAQVYDASFAPNGNQLVSASYDGSLKLWDLTGSNDPTSMTMHIDKVQSCAFSSDGKWIISGGNKGKVILWDNKGAFSKYMASINEPIRDIAVLGDEVIVSGSKGYRFSLSSSVSNGQLAVPFSATTASAISKTNLVALAGGALGTIIVYDLESNEPIQLFRNSSQKIKSIGISNDASIVFGSEKNEFTNGINLSTLSYIWDTKELGEIFSGKHEENGYKLLPIDKYTLSTGFSGKIEMNPRLDGRLRSFTIINAETIAVGGDFSLKLYTRNGVLKGELKGFNGAITSIASINNRLIALCQDQTIRIWNLSSFELLASIYVASKNNWICWTPQGYYQASSGGEKFIGWQIDEEAKKLSKFYKSSVFSSKFHKPEMVKQTIGKGSFEIAKEKEIEEQAVLAQSNNKPVTKNVSKKPLNVLGAAPSIDWITPELQTSDLNQSKITIKAKVKSNSKIKLVKILVNGRPSSNSRGVVIPKSVGEFDILIEQELIVSNDITEVRIFVANQEAKMVSEKRIINLTGVDARGKGRSMEVVNYLDRPDLYILSIGISDYSNSEYNLNYADDDAESISDVFEKIGTEVYKDVNSVKLLNSEADKQAILDAFDNLTHKVQAKDMVLIFIASHGINEEGEFFILPHDADLIQHPDKLVSWKDLTQTLSGLPSNVVVMIDACRSGQLGVNLTKYGANNTEALRNASSDENGLVLMAASTGNESALETPQWGHGAFTLAILEGIEKGKADFKPDGTIYLRELDLYVSERTIELTNNVQHPTTQKPSTISRLSIINLNK
ncbi:MAG: caspase family protein [Cyclobacteriaceae bacterium]|nr:caspase family protein [Cyclobacteriaceae bacterium]